MARQGGLRTCQVKSFLTVIYGVVTLHVSLRPVLTFFRSLNTVHVGLAGWCADGTDPGEIQFWKPLLRSVRERMGGWRRLLKADWGGHATRLMREVCSYFKARPRVNRFQQIWKGVICQERYFAKFAFWFCVPDWFWYLFIAGKSLLLQN